MTGNDKLGRVRTMLINDGRRWYLSPNDKEALRHVVMRYEQMEQALRAVRELADFEYTNAKYAGSALAHIANKAAEGLGE